MTEGIIKSKAEIKWIGSKIKDDSYTSDDVIKAFEAGKKKGESDANSKVFEKIKMVVSDLWDISKQIEDFLKVNNFRFHNIYLNIENDTFYKILVPIKEEDIIDPKFMATYDFAWELEEKIKAKHKEVDIMFYFSSFNKRTFDVGSVVCDGYQFKYLDN